jgi:regulator of sirC expression with transglutaminase-like and TPR domain
MSGVNVRARRFAPALAEPWHDVCTQSFVFQQVLNCFMPSPLQFQALTPLDYFATLVADDASLSLIEAAVALAQDDDPKLDALSVLAEIDALADRLKRRIPADAVPVQRLRWLNRFFFEELGFSGNVNDYYDPGNSHLSTVLHTRRGIPITLAVLYIELASQIGLKARGVSFPGHFLIKLSMPEGEVVIDPFTGQSLSREQLDELLAPYRRRQGLVGDYDVPLGLFLQAAPARDVLARMLRNLKEIYRSTEDWARLLNVENRLVILLPQDWQERRDRGFTHAQLGNVNAGLRDLADYLKHVPQASDRDAVMVCMAELSNGGSGRVH